MSTRDRYARWRRTFAATVERNRVIDARTPIVPLDDATRAAAGACSVLAGRASYWFRRNGRVRDWNEVKRSGQAACSEAAALAAALALNRGARSVVLCIEEHPRMPGYSHVAAYVGGQRVDCYADRSLEVDSCRYTWAYGPEGWE